MTKDRLIQYMRKLAISSSYPNFKVGAAIFFKKKIISTGLNQGKSHPHVKERGPDYSLSVHAELHAIFKAEKRNPNMLKGSTLVVYREDREGNIKSSRPCPMCMERIKAVGIKFIVYSTEQGMVTEKVKDFKEEYSMNYQMFYKCMRTKTG